MIVHGHQTNLANIINKNLTTLCFTQVIAVSKSSDIVLMVLDASKVSTYHAMECCCSFLVVVFLMSY